MSKHIHNNTNPVDDTENTPPVFSGLRNASPDQSAAPQTNDHGSCEYLDKVLMSASEVDQEIRARRGIGSVDTDTQSNTQDQSVADDQSVAEDQNPIDNQSVADENVVGDENVADVQNVVDDQSANDDENVDEDQGATEDESADEESGWRRWRKKGHPALIVVIAVLVLAVTSLVPWGKLTANFIKDFDLLADLKDIESDSTLESTDFLDPALELELELQKINAGRVAPQMASDTIPGIAGGANGLVDNPPLDTLKLSTAPNKPLREGNLVILEDYTPEGRGLANLRRALANRDVKPARIGVIGDSYIEGDILTMDLRNLFQDKYGGRGVGYLAAHSMVQGFRTSVRHSDNGWVQQPLAKISGTNCMPIAGEFYTGSVGSVINISGVDINENLKDWCSTRVLFISPNSGTITITADNKSFTFDVAGAPGVQSVVLPAETSSVKIQCNVPGLQVFGVWVEDGNGIVLDNMSVRGDSGISRRYVNVSLSSQLRQWVDYDLIIVEYGINAMTSSQTDYTKYSEMMVNVLQRLKQCYPNADIILMGIGDRGQKIHGTPHSFPTAPNMVAAQRQAAKTAGVMFWDTREAMGGEDAVVRWREEGLINGDYIHLNHDGGNRLGGLLFDAINHNLNKR